METTIWGLGFRVQASIMRGVDRGIADAASAMFSYSSIPFVKEVRVLFQKARAVQERKLTGGY